MSLSWKGLLYIAGIWLSGLFGDASILPNSGFETLSYEGIVREVMVLAAEYPHLAQVTEQSINPVYSKAPVIRLIQRRCPFCCTLQDGFVLYQLWQLDK